MAWEGADILDQHAGAALGIELAGIDGALSDEHG